MYNCDASRRPCVLSSELCGSRCPGVSTLFPSFPLPFHVFCEGDVKRSCASSGEPYPGPGRSNKPELGHVVTHPVSSLFTSVSERFPCDTHRAPALKPTDRDDKLPEESTLLGWKTTRHRVSLACFSSSGSALVVLTASQCTAFVCYRTRPRGKDVAAPDRKALACQR